jgi:flagellar hook assembly protein FlgD
VTIPGGRPVALMAKGPNPFRIATRMEFDVPDGAKSARLGVYNCRGALVKILIDGAVEPGRHPAVWDGTDARGRAVAAGVYFVRLEAGGGGAMTKVVCLR